MMELVENRVESMTDRRCAVKSDGEFAVSVRMISQMDDRYVGNAADRNGDKLPRCADLFGPSVGFLIVDSNDRNFNLDYLFIPSDSQLAVLEDGDQGVIGFVRGLRMRLLLVQFRVPPRATREMPENFRYGSRAAGHRKISQSITERKARKSAS